MEEGGSGVGTLPMPLLLDLRGQDIQASWTLGGRVCAEEGIHHPHVLDALHPHLRTHAFNPAATCTQGEPRKDARPISGSPARDEDGPRGPVLGLWEAAGPPGSEHKTWGRDEAPGFRWYPAAPRASWSLVCALGTARGGPGALCRLLSQPAPLGGGVQRPGAWTSCPALRLPLRTGRAPPGSTFPGMAPPTAAPLQPGSGLSQAPPHLNPAPSRGPAPAGLRPHSRPRPIHSRPWGRVRR